jgi:hypothetical protein
VTLGRRSRGSDLLFLSFIVGWLLKDSAWGSEGGIERSDIHSLCFHFLLETHEDLEQESEEEMEVRSNHLKVTLQ